MPHLRADGTLDLRVELPPRAPGRVRRGRPGRVISGTVQFRDRDVVVDLSGSVALSGPRAVARRVAAQLHAYGVTVRVRTPRGELIVLGRDARPPTWQVLVTRSRHIALGSAGAVFATARAPRLLEVGPRRRRFPVRRGPAEPSPVRRPCPCRPRLPTPRSSAARQTDGMEEPATTYADALAQRVAQAEAQRTALRAAIEETRVARSLTFSDDEHDPDGSLASLDQARDAALLQQTEDTLAELADAQQRLADGAYGVCEVCGQPIGTPRLLARPATRRCLSCATGAGGRRRGR